MKNFRKTLLYKSLKAIFLRRTRVIRHMLNILKNFIKKIFYFLKLPFLMLYSFLNEKIKKFDMFLHNYILENNEDFLMYMQVKANKLKLLFYGTSGLEPKLTGYQAIVLLTKTIFYSVNSFLIIFFQQPPVFEF